MMQRITYILLTFTILLTFSSCRYINTIDDDTSDCGYVYRFTYHMHAVNNTSDQIAEQIDDDRDAGLRASLADLFTPLLHPSTYTAHLLFTQANDGSYQQSLSTMTGDESALSMTLCPTDYRHLAVTGTDHSGALLADSTDVAAENVTQQQRDTIPAQQQAVLTGRKDFRVAGRGNDVVDVDLYPANAAIAVVAVEDPSVKDVRVYATDLASSFTISDSTYHFDRSALVRMASTVVAGTTEKVYHAIVYPSRDSATGTIDAGNAQAAGAVWRIVVLAKAADGTTTHTTLYVQKALSAGQVRVIRIAVGSNGAATVTTAGVGASVTLDWKKGGEYNPDL